MDLVTRLRATREASGLTQEVVSQASGIAVPNLSRIENGNVDMRLSTLVRILDALQVDVELVPRTRRLSLSDVITQSQRGRARLDAAGVTPSDPQLRLDAKTARGVDVSVEQSLLSASAR